MATQTLKLLGPVQVEWPAGKPPRFRSQLTMALLGYLVAAHRPVARKALVALFWPDETATGGQANLRRELHNLGQILPGCWQTDSLAVQFVPGAETQVDIDALRRLDQEQQWPAAAAWVQGEFLEGLILEDNPEFEVWLLGEQERWRQRTERVLLHAVTLEKQRGNYDEARRWLARLLRFVPWHEEGHRQMMRLLAHSGRFSAALKQYEQCRAILAAELDVTPAAATTSLYERIKIAMALPPPNLPAPVTPFIGREDDGAALQRRLADPDCRLLTLTGVGGIGKSRLALEAARLVSANDYQLFLHGVVFVPLVGVDRPDLLAAVGAGLGIVFAGPEPAEHQLLHYLRDMELLLLLDNYEHLLPDIALLAIILRQAPTVKLLVTSRERLKLQEEWVFELSGLPYPEPAEDDNLEAALEAAGELDYAAVRLFAACARRGQRSFSLVRSGREVAAICRLVQGMPLALELSAAQLHSLTPAGVLAEIGYGLDILTAEAGNASPRHASLRAVFDATWAGLSAAEQQVFSRLSLFRGGFTQPAAVAVAGATRPLLGTLADKSLIRLLPSGRYEIHELLRQYAAARLAADPALDEVTQDQYAAYYGAFLQQREHRLLETHQEETLAEMTPEMDNIRLAWRWLAQHGKVAILDAAFWTLASYYQLRGQSFEGLTLVENALTRLAWLDEQEPQQARLRARLHLFQALFFLWQGRLAESRALLEQTLAQLRRWGTPQDISFGLFTIGEVLGVLNEHGWPSYLREGVAIAQASSLRWLEGFIAARLANFLFGIEPVEAKEECEQLLLQALAIAEELDNPFVLMNVFLVDGRLAQIQGDYSRAEHSFEQTLTAARRINHLWLIGMALRDSGTVIYLQGNFAKARRRYEESGFLFRRTGATWLEGELLNAQGNMARAEGDPGRAQEHYQACLALYQEMGLGSVSETYVVHSNLGHALLAQSQVESAANHFRQSLPGMRDHKDRLLAGMVLAGLSGILAACGQPDEATRLAGAAQVQFDAAPRRLDPADRRDWERIQAEVRGQLDATRFAEAWATGRAMSLDQIVARALVD